MENTTHQKRKRNHFHLGHFNEIPIFTNFGDLK